MKNKFIIAVSGGPDSMCLLDIYRKRHKIKAVVHVNYNFRNDSNYDELIVKRYCRKFHLRLFIKRINSKVYEKNNIKNFENWARNKRYLFFNYISKLLNCSNLLVAHHKDDFFETGLLQILQKKTKYFYGMKQKNKILDLNVYRPFLFKYWKIYFIKYCLKNKINFAIDKTNFDPKYSRNNIRNIFRNKTNKKQYICDKILEINRLLFHRYKRIIYLFKKWENNDFEISYWLSLSNNDKREIIRIYLHKNNIKNISSNKIELIFNFLKNNLNNKNLRVSKNIFIQKKERKLIKIIS